MPLLADRWTAICLVAVMFLEIVTRLSDGWAPARYLCYAFMLALLPSAARRLGLREAYLLCFAAVVTGLAFWMAPDPWAVLVTALDQAAFLMAFVLLLGLIQEAAMTSATVAACGRYLTRQPTGRRYLAIFSGTDVMSVLFNLGTVSLIAPLITRGVEETAPGDALNPVRVRRQLSSMLRGFAWSVIWSPTAIAPLALMGLIPGIERGRWILLGLGVVVLVLLIGWVEDQLRWRGVMRANRRRAIAEAPPFPARDFASFAGICAVLFGLSFLFANLSGNTLVFGLMATAPLMMLGWLLVQNGGLTRDGAEATRARVRTILGPRFAGAAPVAVTLACSGFIGRTAAVLIPAEELAQALGLQALPGWLFLWAAMMAVVGLSQFALSPIMMAVFFGSLLGALPELPASPTLTALALSCGWAMSMTASPFATVILLTSRATGHSGRMLTWGWNGMFSVVVALVMVPVFYLLTLFA